MSRVDRFGEAARAYAVFRPHYPGALFDRIAGLAPNRRLAWDCGTGSGQAATALARRFEQVVATDTSTGQLAEAAQHANVRYVCAAAEAAPLAGRSVDLVTAAQALHWFDSRAFFRETGRVLRPGGLVTVWSYDLPSVGPAVDRALRHFYSDIVGAYWAPARKLVEQAYRSIEFPFEEIPFEPMHMEDVLARDAYLGYVATWSATLAYARDRGTDPIPILRQAIEPHWPDPDAPRRVRWTLSVRAGRAAMR